MSEWARLEDVPDEVQAVESRSDLRFNMRRFQLVRDSGSQSGWMVDWLDGSFTEWVYRDRYAPYVLSTIEPGPDPLRLDEPVADDPVSPSHYQGFSNGAEVIDITENLNFCRGNAIKYLARAGKKDPARELEDLEKAQWYVTREIERIKGEIG